LFQLTALMGILAAALLFAMRKQLAAEVSRIQALRQDYLAA